MYVIIRQNKQDNTKRSVFMKNTLKILGIIAFIAVIGFPIVGCASLGGGGGGVRLCQKQRTLNEKIY